MFAKKVVVFENHRDNASFVRRCVIQELAKQGYRILLATTSTQQALPVHVSGEVGQINMTACDITDPKQVEKVLKGAWAVVNLVTAQTKKDFTKLHVEGTKVLAKAASDQGVSRFIQLSDLMDLKNPTSPYTLSRKKTEEVLHSLFPKATIVRPCFLFGGENPFFTRLAMGASFSPFVLMLGSDKARFQLLYVGDFARAVKALLASDQTQGQTYELAGPETLSPRQLIERTLHAAHRRAFIVPVPPALGRLLGLLLHFIPNSHLTTQILERADLQSCATGHYPGLKELGITATPLDQELPPMVGRFAPHF